MARSREITGLNAWIVTLLATALVVAQDATAQEAPSNDAQAYINRGITYYENRDYGGAIADYTQAIQLSPNNAKAYINRGTAYYVRSDKGDNDRALTDFSQAIQLDPKSAQAYFLRGLAYDEKGDYDGAIADYTRAIQLIPKSATPYAYRGYAYYVRGDKGDNDRAIADTTQAIQLDPNNARAYYYRGVAYHKKGDNDRAIADYNQAIQLDPEAAREMGAEQMLIALQKSQMPLDINKQAIDSIAGLTTVLAGITDLGSARAALPKLEEAKAELDRINAQSGHLSAERRKALASVVLPRIPALDQLFNKALAVPGVSDQLKPTIDDLKAKLATLPVETAASEVDWPKLRMAKTVLIYVERCENRSAPGYYVDKAMTIWDSANPSDQKYVSDELETFIDEFKGNEACPMLGLGVRIIVATDFNVPTFNVPTDPPGQPVQPLQDTFKVPVDASKLIAKITRIERGGDKFYYPLIVVDNQSDTAFETTEWSCTFFQNGEPVHEDSFYVKQVAPKGKTAHQSITRTSEPFTSTSCRLLSATPSG